MDDVLGGCLTDPAQFHAFVSGWEDNLSRRVDEATTAISTIEGIRGIILAGSVGRGNSWPLSDIDILLVVDDGLSNDWRTEIDHRMQRLHTLWASEGWWTGVDVGNLSFSQREVIGVLDSDDYELSQLLQDDRWYYSLDKGFESRAVYDPDEVAAPLADWITRLRFSRPVVLHRLEREWSELLHARDRMEMAFQAGDVLESTKALRHAGQWFLIWNLERWGKRDASLARVGTRFEIEARSRNCQNSIDLFLLLYNLEEPALRRRMDAAPVWVWEWHDRSWYARQQIAENVTQLQHLRDVLRVCSFFELRHIHRPPFPEWLGIPGSIEEVAETRTRFTEFLETTH